MVHENADQNPPVPREPGPTVAATVIAAVPAPLVPRLSAKGRVAGWSCEYFGCILMLHSHLTFSYVIPLVRAIKSE